MSRRHALLVGIGDYPGFDAAGQLHGAVADVTALRQVLVDRFAFQSTNIVELIDRQATRAAILDHMARMVERVGPQDQVLFFFSGHGSQMTDREGDEGDGLDETLVPWDGGRNPAANRDITDDEIQQWTAQLLHTTPHVVLIFDCCHSATLHRNGWRSKAIPPDLRPIDQLPPTPVPSRPTYRQLSAGLRPMTLAACGDHQTAFEMPPSIAGQARGALSYQLTEVLATASPSASWRHCFELVRRGVRRLIEIQQPVLTGDRVDQPIFAAARVASDSKQTNGAASHLLELAEQLENLASQVSIRLFRSSGGAWRPADLASDVIWRQGERLRLDLRLLGDQPRWIYLFDVSGDRIDCLYPGLDDHERLDPDLVLSIGAREGDALVIDGEPLEADDPPSISTDHLVLVLDRQRIDAARFMARPQAASDRLVALLPYRWQRASVGRRTIR